ncbi:MAG: GNAT family N-acetyltransferase [Dehalococcoidales bacterium]|nr:GNAT family N-acetyltransferase [Dehalococcoidales bacterium]
MIRQCKLSDTNRIYSIINEAAHAYEGVIPADCYHQPYMPMSELEGEIKRMTFYGWVENRELVGVMGIESVADVTLIRHAYVLTPWQNKGIGSGLLEHLMKLCQTERLLVGTWTANTGAIRLYERYGFKLQPNKDELLRTYWDISPRQIETSIAMELVSI